MGQCSSASFQSPESIQMQPLHSIPAMPHLPGLPGPRELQLGAGAPGRAAGQPGYGQARVRSGGSHGYSLSRSTGAQNPAALA